MPVLVARLMKSQIRSFKQRRVFPSRSSRLMMCYRLTSAVTLSTRLSRRFCEVHFSHSVLWILGGIAESDNDAYCDRCYRSVVCLFVHLSVCHTHAVVHPAKTVGRNEMPFSMDTCVVPSNIVLDRRPSFPREGEIWGSNLIFRPKRFIIGMISVNYTPNHHCSP